jgi:hypothetical protein
MTKTWLFRIFGEQGGDVDSWIAGLPPKARAKLDSIISYMEVTSDWTRTKYFSPIKGHDKIYEIKFLVQNIQYRPLGCYGPGRDEFTLLFGAKEIGDRFEPLNSPLLASKRRNDIFNGKEGTHEYN